MSKPASVASPKGDARGLSSPKGVDGKDKAVEYDSSPPSTAELDTDAQEMDKILAAPPSEARTDPPWQAYVGPTFGITVQDVAVWKEFMECAADDKDSHLEERGPAVVQAFLKMLSNIQSAEARRYLLTVIDQHCIGWGVAGSAAAANNRRKWAALFNSHLRPGERKLGVQSVAEKEREKEANSILYAGEKKENKAAEPKARSGTVAKQEEARVDPYAPFMKLLTSTVALDAYSQARLLHILSTLFVNGGTSLYYKSGVGSGDRKEPGRTGALSDFRELAEYTRYLLTKLSPGSGGARGKELLTVLSATKDLLKNPDVRKIFVDLGGLKALDLFYRHESETHNTQYTYISGFCIWLVTYNVKALASEQLTAAQMDDRKDPQNELKAWQVVQKTVRMITGTNREKVLRMGFATLLNLAGKGNFNEEMIQNGLIKFIDAMGGRKIKDDDLCRDIDDLRRSLEEAVHSLSSFEKYMTEVDSGRLVNSPVHTEQFWRENTQKFEEKSFDYIKRLIGLLDTHDETTLVLACQDLGEFARFHPDGKRIITNFGGKKQLMTIMSSKNVPPRAASAALLAVQKLMVNNWDQLAGSKGSKKQQETSE